MDQDLNGGVPNADDAFVADLVAEGDALSGADQTPQTPEPAPQAQQQPAREPERIPLPEYLQERERRQELERRLKAYEDAEKQKQEPQPEVWQDPNAWREHGIRQAIDPVQQQIQADRLFWSQRFAVQEHGQETVEQAIRSLTELQRANPAEYQRLDQAASSSRDPVGDLVRWHKNQQALQKIGPDPDEFLKKREEELLKDPAFLARAMEAQRAMAQGNVQFRPPTSAQPQPQQRQALPSMRTAGAAAPTGNRVTEQNGDDLLDEIFSAA